MAVTTIFVRCSSWLFWQRAGIVTDVTDVCVQAGRKATEHVLENLL